MENPSPTSFDPRALRADYARFLSPHPSRILLSGHSHQAWPDCARDAMGACFDAAADAVDGKWSQAVFPLMERVGARVLARLGLPEDDPICFGKSTHELSYRLLSALPRDARVLTTRGEFHSLHRQLRRLEEDGLRVVWTERGAPGTLTERLIAALAGGVDLVALSAVFFEDATLLEDLPALLDAARAAGALVLVDAYHAFNVVPLRWAENLEHVFVTAGGYKYAQFGEGVCFLRSPRGSQLRPRYTGWFADFASLEAPRAAGAAPVGYAAGGARFAGATFDPVGLWRADAVLSLFDRRGLDVAALRAINRAQTERITQALLAAGCALRSPRDPARRGGFVAVAAPAAHAVADRLRARELFCDARGDVLRLGPAPYLLDEEIDRGVAMVIEELRRAGA